MTTPLTHDLREHVEGTDPTGDEPIIHLAEGGKAPLPAGYTLERALQVLRDAGLTPDRVEYPDGSIEAIDKEAA